MSGPPPWKDHGPHISLLGFHNGLDFDAWDFPHEHFGVADVLSALFEPKSLHRLGPLPKVLGYQAIFGAGFNEFLEVLFDALGDFVALVKFKFSLNCVGKHIFPFLVFDLFSQS